jgi:hypothetical protein
MIGRWTKAKTDPLNPTWETWEGIACVASVAGGPVDLTVIEQQVRHANEQLELESTYPGRNRDRVQNNVIVFERS